MINAFNSGISGSKSFQSRLDVSANNMANINTTGYKANQTTFSDLMYTNISTSGDKSSLQAGNGVRVSDISSALDEGAVQQTGRNYDVAILGKGYFCVRDANNNTYFTRNGNFQLKKEGQENYLATSNGDLVLDTNLSPIKISDGSQDIKIYGPSLNTSANSNDINIAVLTFENPYALVNDGYGRLSSTAESGKGKIAYDAQVTQGALEDSNVDMITEMSNLIQAQRGFQFSAKVIQTADELENIANNLRQ